MDWNNIESIASEGKIPGTFHFEEAHIMMQPSAQLSKVRWHYTLIYDAHHCEVVAEMDVPA